MLSCITLRTHISLKQPTPCVTDQLLIDCFISVCLVLRYDQSQDGLEEVITVREMINPNDPVKNMIIIISDLHLNSIWFQKEEERFVKFINDLTKMSKVRMEETSIFIMTEKKKLCFYINKGLQLA